MKNSGHTSTVRPEHIFRDRREAGRVLGELLEAYRGDPRVVVLGLARGGVPVAWEVAAALGAPLYAFVVRKLRVPGREEFAMGALGGDSQQEVSCRCRSDQPVVQGWLAAEVAIGGSSALTPLNANTIHSSAR
ncbi:hypothetical protein GO592_42790 (plasmid) [Rhodococcus sp. 21391]|nr:hypothetical protein GO592_42790 [Rhodococcus sp. 21391]